MRPVCIFATTVLVPLTLLPREASAEEKPTPTPDVRATTDAVAARGIDTALSPASATHVHMVARGVGGYFATTLRTRALNPQWLDPEVDGGVALGRTFGPLLLAANAWIGRGTLVRPDTDVEANFAAQLSAARFFRMGAAVRARGEIIDGLPGIEDLGRPVDLLGGATGTFARDGRFVQALAGWAAPRGPFRTGPAVTLTAGLAF